MSPNAFEPDEGLSATDVVSNAERDGRAASNKLVEATETIISDPAYRAGCPSHYSASFTLLTKSLSPFEAGDHVPLLTCLSQVS